MNNPHRGELTIRLAGSEYNTKLNLDSIARIEKAVNYSIVKVASRLAEGELTIQEIASVLYIAIRGGGNDISEKELQAIIWDAGLIESMKCCGEILTNALTGGDSGKRQEMASV